jgi:pilus assembly protein CpaE
MSSPVVLATDNSDFANHVRDALGGDAGRMRWWSDDLRDGINLPGVVAELVAQDPTVVALGPGLDDEIAIGVATLIDQHHPEISVILVAKSTPELLESALRAGVRDVVAPDAGQSEIQKAMWRATASAERRRANLAAEVGTAPAIPQGGKVVGVIAPKGGSGKTALAVNTAIALAQAQAGRVAIVDLDLLFGDVTNALLLDPEHSIGDAIEASRVDATTLKVLLTRRSRDVYVLTAPDSPAQGELVTDALVIKALDALRHEFDYIVVDTAAGLTEVTLAAIEQSDELVFICDMSVSAVRGLHKVINALGQLGLMSKRRHFVLNRADSKVGLSVADVEAAVGMRVDVRIPSSRLVPRSMNEGRPLVESSPKAPVARSFMDVAELISETEITPKKSAGWSRGRRG